MPYCHNCGSEVSEENSFCPKCGAALNADVSRSPMPSERYRSEKQEKHEKNEKEEKMEKGEQQEKYEKREYGILGPLVGGIILIVVGLMMYLSVSGIFVIRSIFPFFLIIIGVIVIVSVVIGVTKAKRRNPRP